MCGGGTNTTTQSVSIPPDVMARYNSVNARAEEVAQQPFQKYSGEFVAPLNQQQQTGINSINQAAQSTQPYFSTAAGLTLSGAQDVGKLTPGQINQYMNPYIGAVVDPTIKALQQQQGQQLSQQQAEAIKSGAFGGDRAGIARAVLQGQQGLATSQAIAPLYAQGYQQAVQTATGQQGVEASDLARRMQAGQQVANLGTQGQQAALTGAQAQLQAGTLGQQTQQAQDTAQYQQFLQERGYPFQVAQFLANIAMGTGSLSGSTTTTTQPTGFFSDERLKENITQVGETNDGQPIYRYNYKGDPRTQIGLLAQEVEKDHPEAVGESDGYKTVDYKKATDDSVRHNRAYGGGLDMNAFGGAVTEAGHYAVGGLIGDSDLSSLLAAQQKFFGPYAQGVQGQGAPYGGASGIVPQASLPVSHLATAGPAPSRQSSGFEQAAGTSEKLTNLYKAGKEMWNDYKKPSPTEEPREKARGGLIVPRDHYEIGGSTPYDIEETQKGGDPISAVVKSGQQHIQSLPKPGAAPTTPSGADTVKNLASLGGAGLSAAKGIGSLGTGLGQLGSLASGTAAEGVGIGSALGSIGSGLASALPFLAFLSDERTKDNKEKIGKLYDGQDVYRYDHGDGRTRMGLMAQEVEGHNPDAVRSGVGGIKMVDYRRATEDAAHYAFGGVARQHFDDGGDVYGPSHPADEIFNRRVIPIESGGKQFDKDGRPLTSPAGAIGIAQVMPSTAPEAAKLAGLEFDDNRYRTDPEYNKALGRSYFRAQYDRYQNPEMAMAAYNAGPGNVDRALSMAKNQGGDWRSYLPSETQGYIGSSAKKATDQAGTPSGSLSLASMIPTHKDASGKESANWEKLLIPALSAVGSALASQRTTLGGALGEGVLGGISGYQNVAKMQAELPKTEAETQVQRSSADRINMMTRALRAGMLEYRAVPGIGLQVFDKENPFPVTVTDEEGRPLPGAETLVREFMSRNPTFNFSNEAKAAAEKANAPKEGQPAATAQPAYTAPSGKTSDISKFVPPDVHPSQWSAVTEPPKEYIPAKQQTIMGVHVPEEERKKYMDQGSRESAILREKALGAPDAQLIIDKMAKDFSTVNRDKFTAAGPSAEVRNRIAAGVNDAARLFGAESGIDPSNVAAFEGIQKGTANLGFKTANAVTNSRVPFDLVKSATEANPKITNSPLGAAMLLRNIEQGLQLERDKAQFFANYFRDFRHTEGAQQAFEKLNPASKYVDRGVYKAMEDYVPQNQREYLAQYVANNPDKREAAMRKFDNVVGVKGAAKILLGEK